jgi:hypothetical protein
MSRRVAAAVAFTLAVAATGAAARAQDAVALVATHCAECHSGPDATRGFDATALFAAPTNDATDAAAAARRERAQQALLRVRSHTMPPPDADAQPDATARRALVAAFAALTPAEPGARVASARRLTRLQYERSVRDLVGVQWSARDQLPEDPRVHGFDTIGDASGVTPALVYARGSLACP